MDTKVVFFDLWKTLVTSHCKEPVWTLQRILGHGIIDSSGDTVEPTFCPDDEFLRHCLTTPIAEPMKFMQETARKFNGAEPTEPGLEQFLEVLRQESLCTARYLDVKATVATLIERGYRVGVISNLWAFPASYIFDTTGLGKLFPEESRIYSFEVGHRKPDPEIFYAACERFGVKPEECLMVGDNVEADVRGALKVGMKAALIDRPNEVNPDLIPADALVLRTLTELLPHLGPRSQE